jgi:hypothetical protein
LNHQKKKKKLGPWLSHALHKPQIAPLHQPKPLIPFHEIQMLKTSTTRSKKNPEF